MKKSEVLEVSALIVAYSVVVSIMYDFFFFIGLGVDLSFTPLGPVDFLRGWMEWTSKGVFFFIGLFIHFVVRRIESWKTEDEIVNATSNPQQARALRDSSAKLIYWSAAFMFAIFLLLGEMVYTLAILAVVLAGAFIVFWFLRGTSFAETLLHPKWSSLWTVLIFCAVFGYLQGAEVMNVSKKYQMTTSVPSMPDVEVVRLFDQWSLVRISEKELGWYFHQSDRLIKFAPERRQFIGAYCFYWQQMENSKPLYCANYRHLAPAKSKSADIETMLHE